MKKEQWHFNTRTIHAGQEPDPTTGAIMPPIYQTSTYIQSSPGVHQGYEYARTHNRTREAFEKCAASLENAEHGVAFASGCAATLTCMHLFAAGDHIICSDDLYGGTYRLFTQGMEKFGLEFSFVDMTDLTNIQKALRSNTRGVWVESPTNPLLKIFDIRAIAGLCDDKGLLLMVDNTFMSPYFQQPLDLGARIVVHSTTKFINGHSDVVGGIVLTREAELVEKLRFLQNTLGAVPGPQDCWLALRGVKTLALRMQRHAENAARIAEFLEKHPQVERVLYPGLPSHPQHALAKQQMSGFGGMITFFIRGDLAVAKRFLERVEIFSLAESLGGVESLIEHPGIMTHASLPVEVRERLGISDNLIRLSVGIEDVEDLIGALGKAFEL